jgi:hypothetical protein
MRREKMMRLLLAIMFSSLLAQSSFAAEHWAASEEVSTATLAANLAELKASSGFSFSDGRHAIVTFWTLNAARVYQCTTFYDPDMRATAETCSLAVKQ